MHVTKPEVTALSYDGVRYEPDEEGRFDVPAAVGEWLLGVHGWTVAEPPAEPSEKPKRGKK
jgi:hypothetical protein